MTPEQAETIYRQALDKGQKPEMAWQAVIDAIRIESENRMAEALLDSMK
jgi:hypothetical protein